MSINLQEIRLAVQTYISTMVTLSISEPRPGAGAGTVINPNDLFNFDISVHNPDKSAGGIALKNVRYNITLTGLTGTKLIVPPHPMVARHDQFPESLTLPPGSEVNVMCLFPPDERNYLMPGKTNTISALSGKAGIAGGALILFLIFAEPDLAYLFPAGSSNLSEKRLVVVAI